MNLQELKFLRLLLYTKVVIFLFTSLRIIAIDNIVWFNFCPDHNLTLKATLTLRSGSTSIANEMHFQTSDLGHNILFLKWSVEHTVFVIGISIFF